MQHVKYGIRSWNNTMAEKRCHHCGKILEDHYVRVNSIYFCPFQSGENGIESECFSEWAVLHFPGNRYFKAMIYPPELQDGSNVTYHEAVYL